MSEKCKHEEWNPCGNNYYCCTKCGILRTSQQVNLYLEKDKQILNLQSKLAESETDNKTLICDYESRITKHQELMSWLEHDNEQLKQQLEEKDKEINRYADFFGMKNKDFYVIEKKEYDKLVSGTKNLIKEKQIQELEKVRKYVDGITYLAQYIDERVKQLQENNNV